MISYRLIANYASEIKYAQYGVLISLLWLSEWFAVISHGPFTRDSVSVKYPLQMDRYNRAGLTAWTRHDMFA